MALLFQNEPQRSKIWLGQRNQGGKDCYLTREAKQGKKSWEQGLISHKITVWSDRRLNTTMATERKNSTVQDGEKRMQPWKGWEDAEGGDNSKGCTFQNTELWIRDNDLCHVQQYHRRGVSKVIMGEGTLWQGDTAGVCRSPQGRHREVRREPLTTLIWGKKGEMQLQGVGRNRMSLGGQISDNGGQYWGSRAQIWLPQLHENITGGESKEGKR